MCIDVYHLPLSGEVMRTNIDIDEALIGRVMERYGIGTKKEAVDYALRTLVGEPMAKDEALEMEGTGWEGDLDELREVEHGERV